MFDGKPDTIVGGLALVSAADLVKPLDRKSLMSDNADDMQKQFKVAQKGVVRKAVFAVLEGLFGVVAYGEPERQEECILIPIVKKRELELFASSLVMASDELP